MDCTLIISGNYDSDGSEDTEELPDKDHDEMTDDSEDEDKMEKDSSAQPEESFIAAGNALSQTSQTS